MTRQCYRNCDWKWISLVRLIDYFGQADIWLNSLLTVNIITSTQARTQARTHIHKQIHTYTLFIGDQCRLRLAWKAKRQIYRDTYLSRLIHHTSSGSPYMCGSRNFRWVGTLAQPIHFDNVLVINLFNRRLYRPPSISNWTIAYRWGFVSVFLRTHTATCDFQGGGSGPLVPPPLNLRMPWGWLTRKCRIQRSTDRSMATRGRNWILKNKDKMQFFCCQIE